MPAISTALAILSGVAQLAGSAAAQKANRENERSLMAQKSELAREYNEGVLEDEGSKAYLRTLNGNVRDNMRGIDNSIVSTGATSENRIAQMGKANEVISDAIGDLLEREDRKKAQLFSMQRQVDRDLSTEKTRQAQNWVDIASNVANSAANLGESYLDDIDTAESGSDTSTSVTPNVDYGKVSEANAGQSSLDAGIRSDAVNFARKNTSRLFSGEALAAARAAAANESMAGKIMAGDGSYDDERRLRDDLVN